MIYLIGDIKMYSREPLNKSDIIPGDVVPL